MNSAKQIDAEGPRHVTPTSRSGLRERPQWVALGGRSGSIVLSSRDRHASDLGVSLWPSRSGSGATWSGHSDRSLRVSSRLPPG
ncbi:hypothetical protein F2Q69_00055431 [Brassica cretica]|uniref:Uncharacterized protein n=1 Tax=Brassica cretica TaxID=69181 RepID=A0A8S9N327_BRACR|nr:hypothetical protein F2Q69_00055431 [Brassica cretica]